MILIIGESCLDIFHYGECHRLCPDAPVPVFKSVETVENGGMAMNVYNNVKSLNKNVEILTNKNWKSIKKTRFVETKSNHMFMRLDENDDSYGVLKLDEDYLSNFEAIIVSENFMYPAQDNAEYSPKECPAKKFALFKSILNSFLITLKIE